MLIAMGRKMTDLVAFSPRGPSRSARTATISPTPTMDAGTSAIHSSVLNSVTVRNSFEVSSSA